MHYITPHLTPSQSALVFTPVRDGHSHFIPIVGKDALGSRFSLSCFFKSGSHLWLECEPGSHGPQSDHSGGYDFAESEAPREDDLGTSTASSAPFDFPGPHISYCSSPHRRGAFLIVQATSVKAVFYISNGRKVTI